MQSGYEHRSTEWVKRLAEVVLALNSVDAKSSTTYSRPVGLEEKRQNYSKNVRHLYAAGELEGGQTRALDQIWYLKFFGIKR